MSKNVYFVSSDKVYHKYAIMCINSLIANTKSDIIWLQMDYINHDIQSEKLKYLNVNTSDYDYIYNQYYDVRGHSISNRQIHTSARFIELDKIINSGQYDNLCLLDADMVVINRKMDDVFNLVNGSEHLICANENFKWVINNNYTCDGKPIFEQETRLMNFSCSVPLFFSCSYMKDFCQVFLYYFTHSKQHHRGEQQRDIDDMFIYNIVLQKLGKSKNMFLFPAEMFTQTHMDGYFPWNLITKSNGMLYTEDLFMPILSLHGRLIDQSYQDMIRYQVRKRMGQLKFSQQTIDQYMPRLNSTLKTVQKEFRKYE